MWIVSCATAVLPLVFLGVIYLEPGDTSLYLIGVGLLLLASLLLFNVCCTLLIASFSVALAREPHFVLVVSCLCCVPTTWLVAFVTYGSLCVASEDKCATSGGS